MNGRGYDDLPARPDIPLPNHPLDPFLDQWFTQYPPDTVEARLRIYLVFATKMPWTRYRLRYVLRSLLTWDPASAQEFDSSFDAFFSFDDTPFWLKSRLEPPPKGNFDCEMAIAELRSLATTHELRPVIPLIRPPYLWPKTTRSIVIVALYVSAALVLLIMMQRLENRLPPPEPPRDMIIVVPTPELAILTKQCEVLEPDPTLDVQIKPDNVIQDDRTHPSRTDFPLVPRFDPEPIYTFVRKRWVGLVALVLILAAWISQDLRPLDIIKGI